MSEFLLPLSMIVVLLMGIFAGYPVAILLGGIAVVFGFSAGIPPAFFGTLPSRIFTGTLSNWLLLAVPLFVFMGIMLDRSEVAKRLLLSLERLFAQTPGGLALAVTILGIIMAASTGIVGASVVMLGMMAMPVMLKQGYDKGLASGVVAASGTLGILIPPSIMLVLIGDILQISVGDLFVGAFIPGLMLGMLYLGYIYLRARLDPQSAPVKPVETLQTDRSVVIMILKDLLMPATLILGVLGSIVMGVATPTEAASIGALGAMLLALVANKLTWATLREAVKETTITTSMILFIGIGATAFSLIFKRLGGESMIEEALFSMAIGPYGTIMLILSIVFVLGFFLEWIEISYIVLPLFASTISGLDFGLGSGEQNLIWFAILIAVNMQTSFLTPPLGYALFYLKGIVPPEVGIRDIYRGIVPFVLLQLLGLSLILLFPAIALWLPSVLGP